MTDEPVYTTIQALIATGASYRQIDYWIRKGYVNGGHPGPGTGNPRMLTFDQVVRIGLLADLTRLGLRPSSLLPGELAHLAAGEARMLGSVALTYRRTEHRATILNHLENS